MHDDFDAPAQAPSDFPSDPVFYFDGFFPSVAGVALAWTAAGWLAFKGACTYTLKLIFDDVWLSAVKLVAKVSAKALAAKFPVLAAAAGGVARLIRHVTGQNLALSEEISKEYKILSEALSGVKEVVAPAYGTIAGDNSGTIINIAVNTGPTGTSVGDAIQALGGPGIVQGGSGGSGSGMPLGASPAKIGHNSTIWLALNVVHDEWKNTAAMVAIFKSAQIQLIYAADWTPPRPPAERG